MNYIKGFRFHPTDAEVIEFLWDKIELDRVSIVPVGDSLVEVITQLKDICEFEPGDLPGLSDLESGDNVWYFFCSPRYKYRNSKRKNRVTKQGYWKPTGKPRKIVTTTYDGIQIIGSRQTLVFYNGRVSDEKQNENKTSWVMHEFELTLNLPKQKSLTLCKLKKKYRKVDIPRGEEDKSSQDLPTNNAILEEQLNSNGPVTESVAITEYSGIHSQCTTDKQNDDEFVDSLLIKYDEFYRSQAFFVDEINEHSEVSMSFYDMGYSWQNY